jgi:hypothetical protein
MIDTAPTVTAVACHRTDLMGAHEVLSRSGKQRSHHIFQAL